MIKSYIELSLVGESNEKLLLWNPDRVVSMRAEESLYEPFSLVISYAFKSSDYAAKPTLSEVLKNIGISLGSHVKILSKGFNVSSQQEEGVDLEFFSYESVKDEKPDLERIFIGKIVYCELDSASAHLSNDANKDFSLNIKISSFLDKLKTTNVYSSYRNILTSQLFSKSLEVAEIDNKIDFSSLLEIENGNGGDNIKEIKADIEKQLSSINDEIKKKEEELSEVEEKIDGYEQSEPAADTKNSDKKDNKKTKHLDTYIEKITHQFVSVKASFQEIFSLLELEEDAVNYSDISEKLSHAKDGVSRINEELQGSMKTTDLVKDAQSIEKLNQLHASLVKKADDLSDELNLDTYEKAHLETQSSSTFNLINNALSVLRSVEKDHSEEENAEEEGKDSNVNSQYLQLSEEKKTLQKTVSQLKQQAQELSASYSSSIPKDADLFNFSEFIIPGVDLWKTNKLICSDTKSVFISDWEKTKTKKSEKEFLLLMQGNYVYYPFYGCKFSINWLDTDLNAFEPISESLKESSFIKSTFFEDEKNGIPLDVDITISNKDTETSEKVQLSSLVASRNKEVVIESAFSHQQNMALPVQSINSKIVGKCRRMDVFPGMKVLLFNKETSKYNTYIVEHVNHHYTNDNNQNDYLVTTTINIANGSLNTSEPDSIIPVQFDDFPSFNKNLEMVVLPPSSQTDFFGGFIEQDKDTSNKVLLVYPHLYHFVSSNKDKLSEVVDKHAVWVRQIQSLATPNSGSKVVPSSGARAIVAFKDSRPYLPFVLGYTYNPLITAVTSDDNPNINESIMSWYVGGAYISIGPNLKK